MGLGASAYTTASHFILVIALLLMVWRLIGMFHNGMGRLAIERGLLPGLAVAMLGVAVERIFYIVARLLRPYGHDLWSLHPAPEVLSVLIVVTLYVPKAALVRSLYPAKRARRRLIAEGLSLAVIWVVVAGVLY